jgi:hypothetical protein
MKKSNWFNTPLHVKRILICFAALALILACVPATPVPIPTLTSNDINVLIQWTADAASMQTLTAVPTFTLTSTITATPRNTFTPEPSTTPIATFFLPTSTPSQRVQYFRVKHDSQLAEYDFKSRTVNWTRTHTPETVPLFPAPKLGTGTSRTPLVDGWEKYMSALNDSDEGKLNYLKSPISGLFNGAGFPQLESLTMGGNLITLDRIDGEWGQVHTQPYGIVGSVETENYKTRPDLVHKFVVVVWNRKTKSTYWTNPPQGAIYWPFVSRNPVWIPMDLLEPFPILPMDVTVAVDQEVRAEPGTSGEPTGKQVHKGETITIVSYRPLGSEVWGRIEHGNRWIALFMYQKTGPTYFTSWSMATLPPP